MYTIVSSGSLLSVCTAPLKTSIDIFRGVTASFRTSRRSLNVDIEDPDPVVLVHGFGDTCGTPWWREFRKYLLDVGWSEDCIHTVSAGLLPLTTVGSPRRYAEKVEEKIIEVSEAHGEQVDVIAHSMGGLASRWCIEQGDAEPYVDDLVTVGSPHEATSTARLAAFTGGGRAMLKGSPFLEVLNGSPLAETVDYTAVWSPEDSIIIPQESAARPGPDVRSICVKGHDHMAILFEPDAIEQYLPALADVTVETTDEPTANGTDSPTAGNSTTDA